MNNEMIPRLLPSYHRGSNESAEESRSQQMKMKKEEKSNVWEGIGNLFDYPYMGKKYIFTFVNALINGMVKVNKRQWDKRKTSLHLSLN